MKRPKNFTTEGMVGSYYTDKMIEGEYARADSMYSAKALATIHDTTDDIMLTVNDKDVYIDIEMPGAVAEAFANWVLQVLAYRRSSEGQAEKQRARDDAQKRAKYTIHWRD